MAYAKFDDPTTKVDQSARKVYGAWPVEAMRRAAQGLSNRVLYGTAGVGAAVAVGATGLKTTYPVEFSINGSFENLVAADNIIPPVSTQPAYTVAKYLVSAGATGTAGVTGPGNIITEADYTTVALAAAAAKLPDLPDGHCPFGYMTFRAGSVDMTWGTSIILSSGTTQGTATYADLICMPYDG